MMLCQKNYMFNNNYYRLINGWLCLNKNLLTRSDFCYFWQEPIDSYLATIAYLFTLVGYLLIEIAYRLKIISLPLDKSKRCLSSNDSLLAEIDKHWLLVLACVSNTGDPWTKSLLIDGEVDCFSKKGIICSTRDCDVYQEARWCLTRTGCWLIIDIKTCIAQHITL